MAVKVTTLIENYVSRRGLVAEHGLSMLFEIEDKMVLFDTGASNNFINNAILLGKKLEDVDFLVLSHAHSDHTGGLSHFLNINSKAKVICKKSIFVPKFRQNRNNGINNIKNIDMSRFICIDNSTEIADNLFVVPNIQIINTNDTHFSNFEIETEEGRVPDKFDDELAIVIANNTKISIFSACSHRGITNIISSAQKLFIGHKIDYLVGGFHLVDSPDADALTIVEFLKNNMPQHIGICHCTGIDKYVFFKKEFGDKLFYNHCGTEILL